MITSAVTQVLTRAQYKARRAYMKLRQLPVSDAPTPCRGANRAARRRSSFLWFVPAWCVAHHDSYPFRKRKQARRSAPR